MKKICLKGVPLRLAVVAVLMLFASIATLHATPGQLPPGKGKFVVELWDPGTPIPGAGAPGHTRKGGRA